MDVLTDFNHSFRAKALNKVLLAFFLLAVSSVSTAVTLRNDEILDIDYFEVIVNAVDKSVVNLGRGGQIRFAMIRDGAFLNIRGGVIDTLILRDNASAAIMSATISTITASNNSQLFLSDVGGLTRLVLKGNSRIEMVATGLDYDGDYLSGFWANGLAFNIHMVNSDGVLNNGLPGYITLTRPNPGPALTWLLGSAFNRSEANWPKR